MDGTHSVICTMLRRALAVQACAHRNDYFVQIANHIIVYFTGFNDDNLAPLRCKRSFNVLEAESGQSVSMLYDDDLHFLIRKKARQSFAVTVHARSDLLDGI